MTGQKTIDALNQCVLDGEEIWYSEAIDNTSAIIRMVKEVCTSLLELNPNDQATRYILQNLTVLGEDGWPNLDLIRWKGLGERLQEKGCNADLAANFLQTLASFRSKYFHELT